jgi:hypothetical protein
MFDEKLTVRFFRVRIRDGWRKSTGNAFSDRRLNANQARRSFGRTPGRNGASDDGG